MKNQECLPNKVVNAEKRLSVYKAAIKFINRKKKRPHRVYNLSSYDAGLCILLPCILWNINYLKNGPYNISWDYRKTSKMFPELTKRDINAIQKTYNSDDTNLVLEKRLKLLTSYVKKLEKKLNKL